MKESILFFAVAVTTATALPRVVCAQETPAAPMTTNAQSGYTLFLQAGRLFQPTPKDLSITGGLAPTEKLRRQRLRIARNAEALKTFRAALRVGIIMSDLSDREEILKFYPTLNNLSLLSDDEIAVSVADKNWEGAQQTSLDTLEFGNQIGRGGMMNYLNYFTRSRQALEGARRFASQLNAQQSRDFANRWKLLSEQAPTYQQTLRDEEQIVLRAARSKSASQQPDTAVEEQDNGDLEREVQRVFQQGIESAAMPYQAGIKSQNLENANDFIKNYASFPLSRNNRFGAASVTLGNRLFIAALQLRAIKIESGGYPQTFDAGVDPFSPDLAPLIYKREGDSYVLYSVGPDGKDENGAEIQTLRTNQETGTKSVSDRLSPDSFGDIVAPVL